jgi:antitoxin (DNA-binding transcriptional repressor) of toxin-antitoxin stability system
MCWRLALN